MTRMLFSTLLQRCHTRMVDGTDPEIDAITADSRKVKPGTLFVALRGTRFDGTAFIPQAIAQGASAIVTDRPHTVPVPVVVTKNPAHFLAIAAAALAGPQPRHVAAVTGTNGKSSTAEFLRQLWTLRHESAASMGTLGLITSADVTPPPSLTTPDPVSLARVLSDLARAGVNHVALEASSHGLDQHRLDGVAITSAGFSNLTRDHLDYHGTIDAYRRAKLRLFTGLLPKDGIAAINADMDPETLCALRALGARFDRPIRETGRNGTTLRLLGSRPTPLGQVVRLALHGEALPEITLALPGLFQAENALLAAAMCWQDDAEARRVVELLPQLTGVRGRCERAATLPNGAAAYVDYAHTPDALQHVLDSLRPHTAGKLVVVFGAGGDRDRGKRPLMGETAARLSDLAIITDDNPRSENPAAIRAEIRAACPDALEIGDRRSAIAAGLEALRAGDILVVAGKGHEQGQTIGETVLPFDDRTVLQTLAGIA